MGTSADQAVHEGHQVGSVFLLQGSLKGRFIDHTTTFGMGHGNGLRL